MSHREGQVAGFVAVVSIILAVLILSIPLWCHPSDTSMHRVDHPNCADPYMQGMENFDSEFLCPDLRNLKDANARDPNVPPEVHQG